jgi:hypothetical protein
MKKNLYLIIGSAIIIGAFLFLRKKKVADDKAKAEESAKAEEILKKNFETAVQESGAAQAEAMNIDLINEKKARALMPVYDALWKEIFKLGTVTASNKYLISLKSQIKDVEYAVNKLGYRIDSNPRGASGSQIIKKA